MLNISRILDSRPSAEAIIKGSADYPSISGILRLYQTRHGTLVSAEAEGLPSPDEPCAQPVFGFHIHTGESCSGTAADPFANALGHYNPFDCPHPHHSGDMPPLFGNSGYAYMVFLTDRFAVSEVIGKTVIIHAHPDDFTTQPSGNSGQMMACGVIEAVF